MIIRSTWTSLVLLFACWIVGALPQTHGDDVLKVISYNIRYANSQDGADGWSQRRDAVGKALGEADVVGLQEVLSSQLADLRKQLPDFEWYGVGRDDGQSKGEMVPIGFRKSRIECLEQGTFWLSDRPEIAGSVGWDAALPRIASWIRFRDRNTKCDWLMVNTHFDHRGSKARAESGQLLRAWIAEHKRMQPCILTGDFNAQVKSDPMQNLIDAHRGDATPALLLARDMASTADTGPDSTWNGFKKIEPSRRIDHILVGDRVKVRQFTTLDPRTPDGRFASDHLPIEVLLTCER